MPHAEISPTIRLFYTDDGSGGGPDDPPLLLVHGWGADSHQWSWHIDALAPGHRVLAVDLRGHGYSSVPETGNTPRAMAEDLDVLLDRLDVPEVIAVGHSMGGQVVSILAVEHPGRVRALVTLDPGYGMTQDLAGSFPEMIAGLRGEHAHAVAEEIDRWCTTSATPAVIRRWHKRRLYGMPPHVLAEAFEAMFTAPGAIGVRPASDDHLARRNCPALSIWADPGRAAWEEGLLKQPGSKVVCWEGSGHRLHEERPAEFVRLLEGWLRGR
ncbi:alpha/beta hydrolase [Nonomuraea sp. WAC 01424]|uniref:alpha/beta fold hydrolase n=1 Tax=Nonomuraea sp. WAC 01424 TaxID=2203200 RepID=UPI000F794DED|nr:alpha/beta hydrolase [Nonomuraea sp. WAC 01424]RSN15763.1 alpha/beta hydrolase [Nonomuraea sp. WAC 01424]